VDLEWLPSEAGPSSSLVRTPPKRGRSLGTPILATYSIDKAVLSLDRAPIFEAVRVLRGV